MHSLCKAWQLLHYSIVRLGESIHYITTHWGGRVRQYSMMKEHTELRGGIK